MAEGDGTTTTTETTTTAADWRTGLTGDYAPLAAEPSLASFKGKDWSEVGPVITKAFVDTKRLVGAKQEGALKVPGPNAPAEEVAAFRAAIGVPPSPAEYKVKAHEMMAHPQWNQEAQAEFVKGAHANGFTPAQLDWVVGWYGDFVGKSAKDNARLETEAKVELRNAWGANYDTYMGAANRGLTRMEKALGMEAGTLVEATKGADPAAIAQLFHHIESTFVEHGFVVGEPVAGVGVDEAAAKITALYKELDTVPYQSPRADEIREEIIKYQAAANRARRAA